jgi:hypothetical protein
VLKFNLVLLIRVLVLSGSGVKFFTRLTGALVSNSFLASVLGAVKRIQIHRQVAMLGHRLGRDTSLEEAAHCSVWPAHNPKIVLEVAEERRRT